MDVAVWRDLALYLVTRPPWKQVLAALARPKVGLCTCVACLVAALICGWFYVERSNRFGDLISRVAQSELESTPQRYKGLEAILHAMDDGSSAPFFSDKAFGDPKLGSAQVASEVTQLFGTIARALKRLSDDLADRNQTQLTPANGEGAEPQGALPEVITLELINAGGRHPILTENLDEAKFGFLFVPSEIIRNSSDYETIKNPEAAEDVTVDLEDSLCVDVLMARAVRPSLAKLTDTSVAVAWQGTEQIDLIPKQVYFITRHGVNEIHDQRAPDAKTARNIYRKLFRSTQFFPSRPYFWKAVQDPSATRNGSTQLANSTLGTFFYITKPYVDIGGNGLVITLAKAYDEIPGLPTAVV